MKNCKGLVACVLAVMLLTASFAALGEEIEIPDVTFIKQQVLPDNEAMAFLKKMGVGWNLGNTFDAIKGAWNMNADEMTVETSWVGVKTTPEMFDALKNAGFSSVRIPVSWHDHVDSEMNISQRWMDRVQEVVDYAYSRGFYVILNIHHDEDQFLPSSDHYDASAAYIQTLWGQIAERFAEYDEHLIFESMNEPRLINTSYEWTFDANVPACLDAADCLNRLNQLFVDTVRTSGGNNETRYLMVPGYTASPASVLNDYFKLPEDDADNRIIVSVHAYTPYDFALNLNASLNTFEVRQTASTQPIAQFMASLYKKYILNGIPVVIGEFGALNKGDNLQARVNFTAYYTAAASARNMPCLWWDNHGFTGNGELFGLLDRKTAAFRYPKIVEAMMAYAGYDNITPAE